MIATLPRRFTLIGPHQRLYHARSCLSVAAALLLAACTTATTSVPVATPAPGGTVPADWNPPAITSARAVQLFEAVCGASLPNFATAPARMAANGITLRSRMGTATVFSATENVSLQIQDGPGFGKSCSMVFTPRDSAANLNRAVAALGPTQPGVGTLYRGRSVLVMADTGGFGGVSHLVMTSERK